MITLRNHLLSRHLDPGRYNAIIDEVARIATFMCFAHGTNKFTGFQAYRPEGPKKLTKDDGLKPSDMRYFSHAVKGESMVWGFEACDFERSRKLYVCEGIFDASHFHWLGLNAVAVLGCTPRDFRSWASAQTLHTVAVCDGDHAGRGLAAACDNAVYCPPGHDPGSMSGCNLLMLLDK